MDLGLDRLAGADAPGGLLARLRGPSSRVGLLAHPASVDRHLVHAADVLTALGVRPCMLFGPEHGYGGEAQDMIGVAGAVDERTGAPIVSLYGERIDDLSPSLAHLAQLDVLVIDLADVGARYYTFAWTALLALRAAARSGVHVVVLDRPNPVGATAALVEGASQQPGYSSFVGLEPVPVRHALTVGEIVALFAERDGLPLGPDGALSVVAVRGWDRAARADLWDRPFVAPSPNMPTADTAWVYPGGCLVEGTNLSEGRGTTRPFEVVGAPWLDGRRLAERLTSTGLAGFVARPLTFRPTFHKHAGSICGGVQIHPTELRAFRPYATYVALIALCRAQNPERFAFRTERYEFVDHIGAFDLLTGCDDVRRAMLTGDDARAIAEAASRHDPAWPVVMRRAAEAVERAGAR